MVTEQEICENLKDAGCSREEIHEILGCIQKGDRREIDRKIEACRKQQLKKLHESQQCIDRLDYLRYQLEKACQK